MLTRPLSPADKAFLLVLSRTNHPNVLSTEEWNKLLQIINQYGLPVVMIAMVYGFGIDIYEHPKKFKDLPVRILRINGPRLPGNRSPEAAHAREIADLLTHTPENLRILKFYNLEQKENPVECCY